MAPLKTVEPAKRAFQTLCALIRASTVSRGMLACLILTLSASHAGLAATLAYEGFEYAQVGEQLLGKDGGFGFASPWEAVSDGPGALQLVEGSLAFSGLQTSGIRSQIALATEASGLIRNLISSVPADGTTTLYLSFLLRGERGSAGTLNGWFGLGLLGEDEDTSLFVGHIASGAYVLEDFGGGGTRRSPVFPVLNETALFVVRADLMPGPDTFTLYVNPIIGDAEPDTGTVKNDADIQGLNALAIAGGPGAGFSVDEIRIGDTYSDVTPVPEPRTALLLILGAAGAWLRWRATP